MNILVFGGNGQVGTELRRALGGLGRLVVLGRTDADLADLERVRVRIRRESADVVVNAAAYTAVDRAETEPDLAWRINAAAVGAMAEEVARLDGLFVHYSTDYVFDGRKQTAYRESDPTGPLNVYGATKLAGEEAVVQSGCRHCIFRTSWVYAAHGSNFIATILRLLAEREELSVVDDQHGAPTGAAFIADVTATAIARLRGTAAADAGGGIYHLAAAGSTSWHGYAEFIAEIARASGAAVRVAPGRILRIPSTARPQAARRPANSRLDTGRLRAALGVEPPPWEEDVRRVVLALISKPAAA